ncbi:hypothetical protein [Acidithiobacillus ferrivorans]|nr:hypothetical protein [Acidithiobacillus ferrivorans]CDQ10419.1 hypothetical protein AFERRI_400200 [Acidithiobacillus ferrivorans]
MTDNSATMVAEESANGWTCWGLRENTTVVKAYHVEADCDEFVPA